VAKFRPLSPSWQPTLASCSPAASQVLPQNAVVAHSRFRESDTLRQDISTLTTLYPTFGELLRHIIMVCAWTEYIKNTLLRHEYEHIRVYCADIYSLNLSTSAPGTDVATGEGGGTVLLASGAAGTVGRSGTSAAAPLPLPGRAKIRGQKAGAGGNFAAARLLRTWRRRVSVI